jgi:hypothetical protein
MSLALTRENYSNWAGLSYTVANGTMLFKGVIENATQTGDLDLSSLDDDPFALCTGVILTTAAGTMAMAKSNLANAFAMGLNVTANCLLTTKFILEGNVKSAIGATMGLVSSLYTAYNYTKAAISDVKDKRTEVSESFADNKQGILKKYPFLPSGILNVCSSIFIMNGSIEAGDNVMTFISGAWLVGSAFQTFSKKKGKQAQPV